MASSCCRTKNHVVRTFRASLARGSPPPRKSREGNLPDNGGSALGATFAIGANPATAGAASGGCGAGASGAGPSNIGGAGCGSATLVFSGLAAGDMSLDTSRLLGLVGITPASTTMALSCFGSAIMACTSAELIEGSSLELGPESAAAICASGVRSVPDAAVVADSSLTSAAFVEDVEPPSKEWDLSKLVGGLSSTDAPIPHTAISSSANSGGSGVMANFETGAFSGDAFVTEAMKSCVFVGFMTGASFDASSGRFSTAPASGVSGAGGVGGAGGAGDSGGAGHVGGAGGAGGAGGSGCASSTRSSGGVVGQCSTGGAGVSGAGSACVAKLAGGGAEGSLEVQTVGCIFELVDGICEETGVGEAFASAPRRRARAVSILMPNADETG